MHHDTTSGKRVGSVLIVGYGRSSSSMLRESGYVTGAEGHIDVLQPNSADRLIRIARVPETKPAG
jgi:hypothetical protein